MPAKELRYDVDARAALRRGADAVAGAVAVTLGPRGRTVVLDRKFGPPLIINDGVTIARDLEFDDHFENMGAQLLKEVAVKTNDVAGDGTTTAAVLARAMIDDGMRNLAAGALPVELREGMRAAAGAATKAIRSLSKEVKGNDDIRRVASISAGDEEIGRMIADAFERVGRDGVVTVQEGQGLETEVEVVEGMRFDRGFVSPHMVTDQKAMETVLEDALLLITDAKISAVADLLPALEIAKSAGKPLLIVADDVQAEALATLVVNKLRGTFTAIAVKAPGFGDRRKAMLRDLAVLTAGTVISEDVGLRPDVVTADQLGRAGRVTVTREHTTVVNGAGTSKDIRARCEEIRQEIESATSDWDREKTQERLARLSGGIAVIRIGAATEVEMKERRARMEDALAATRAAVDEGIVPGGGVALLRAATAVDDLKLSGDAAVGARVVRRALEAPLRVIADNAGHEGGVVAARVAEMKDQEGFDAVSGDYANLVKRGVVDPTKVVVTALGNAVSIATMVMTTEALVADAPEPEEEEGHGHGHAHGGMGGMGDMGGMEDMDF